MVFLNLAICLTGCGEPVTFEQADALFSANRSAFEEVNRQIIECGAKSFIVGDGHSSGEDCISGLDDAREIEENLERIGVEYVNVDWRNFTGSNEAHSVTYILSRDQLGRGGDAQSLMWRAFPKNPNEPNYSGTGYRLLSGGGKNWYYRTIGGEP